jgi:hypothetical protein
VCHIDGMARVRISTTVDDELLEAARRVCQEKPDSALSSTKPSGLSSPALLAPCTTIIRGLASGVLQEPGEDPVPQRSNQTPASPFCDRRRQRRRRPRVMAKSTRPESRPPCPPPPMSA